LNNLLNTFEVPNLYAADEKAEVLELVRKNGGKSEGTPD
jgi:dynein heavy chain